MKRAKKIISVSVTTILSIILIFMVFVVISSKLSGGEPNFLGYQLKTVLSGSMEPTFKTGSIIAIKPLKTTTNLKKGDVITFFIEQDKLATHRIVNVIKNGNQTMYKTKGDNNENPDPNAVVSQNVIAKYSGFTLPFVGYFTEFANSKNGSAILLIIPGILLLIFSGFSIYKAIRELDTTKKNDSQEII